MGAGSDNGTRSVASSDVVVVNGAGGGTPQLVLAYAAWDVLVGYAPQSSLALTELLLAPSACNITGGSWAKGALPSDGGASGQEGIKGMAKKGQPPYEILENADGSFTAMAASPPSSWKTASGKVTADGKVTIAFQDIKGHAFFSDQGDCEGSPCSVIRWTKQ